MALSITRASGSKEWAFGTGSSSADVRSVSIQKKYGSENEVVNGLGVVEDVIYSGAETTTTETKAADAVDTLASGSLLAGIVTKSSIKYSNEDVNIVSTEKLSITL
jgi:hypothetical protein